MRKKGKTTRKKDKNGKGQLQNRKKTRRKGSKHGVRVKQVWTGQQLESR